MGATKMHFYTDHQIEMARMCKALGHPARIAIVEKLLDSDQLNCSDLRFYIPLAQSTLSRHLKELFEAGLVGYKVVGNNSYYYIQNSVFKEISSYLNQIQRIGKFKNEEIKNVYYRPRFQHKSACFLRI